MKQQNSAKIENTDQPMPNSQIDSTFGSVFGGTEGSQVDGGAGEFNSGFGGTNAVSQIFKEGAAPEDKKRRYAILAATGVAVCVCAGLIWFILQDEQTEFETQTSDAATPAVVVPSPVKADAVTAPTAGALTTEATPSAGEAIASDDEEEGDGADAAPAVAGDSGTYQYNEKAGGPVVKVADGTVVEVSRVADFSVPYVVGAAKNGQFRIPNPPPGEVFWREQGSQNAHKIVVTAPAALGIQFSSPGKVAAGGQLSWSASGEASFYRVEFATDASFSNIASAVSTTQTSAAVKGVAAGKYHVRIGGFNDASGKWEYSKGSILEVQ